MSKSKVFVKNYEKEKIVCWGEAFFSLLHQKTWQFYLVDFVAFKAFVLVLLTFTLISSCLILCYC